MSLMNRYTQEIPLKTRAVHLFLLLIFIDVLLAVLYMLTVDYPNGQVTRLFHVDIEKNIPSTYSTLQLILAGIMVFLCIPVDNINPLSKRFTYRDLWLIIGSVLVLMGIDEYISYHEGAGMLLYQLEIIAPDSDSIGGYAWPWTVYGAIFAVVVGVPLALYTYRAFSRYRYLFYLLFLSGVLFVAGAIGLEDFGVYLDTFHASEGANTTMMLEELFEMVAISMVVFIFMRYRGERLAEEWEQA